MRIGEIEVGSTLRGCDGVGEGGDEKDEEKNDLAV